MSSQRAARDLACLTLLAGAVRVGALFVSQTDDADAVARVLASQAWLQEPRLITAGVWLPLNTYIVAAALWVVHDTVVAPIALNILLAVATVVPFYFFASREFGVESGRLAAAAYALYPVALRNSLMALTEVQFAFFLALSLWCLSLSRAQASPRHALLAGVFLTLACGMRYEGWMLIPFLAAVLWPRLPSIALFLVFAGSFPAIWLTGNFLAHGDALYGPHWAAAWESGVEARTPHVMADLLRFFSTWFFGLTPLVALCAAGGAVDSVLRRRPRAIWLVPLGGLTLLLLWKTLDGSLFWRPRYTLPLGMLAIPYAFSEWPLAEGTRRGQLLSTIAVASMIPLSFLGHWLPSPFRHVVPYGVEAIPTVPATTQGAGNWVVTGLKDAPSRALALDFVNGSWRDTYYIALVARRDAGELYVAPGGKNNSVRLEELRAFLEEEPTGTLVLAANGRLRKALTAFRDGEAPCLSTQLVQSRLELELLRYRYDVRCVTGPLPATAAR